MLLVVKAPPPRGPTVEELSERVRSHLRALCVDIPDRHVGSPGNRQACDYFDAVVRPLGFTVEGAPFDCMDWSHGEVSLRAGADSFEAFVSPYSLPCALEASLAQADNVAELEALEPRGKLLLLTGELVREQLMPKSFPFYNPEHHRHVVALLERKRPAAVIAATGRNPQLAGGLYPFPLFEDGDFDIPSVYIRDVDGERLARRRGQKVSLRFDSLRLPATAWNVIARKAGGAGPASPGPSVGPDGPAVPAAGAAEVLSFTAHIDAKKGTPGALDNGAGVATLLGLAELLRDYRGPRGVAIIAFNGEDYYSAPGQQQYLAEHRRELENTALAVNLDGVGYLHGRTSASCYECPEPLGRRVRRVWSLCPGVVEGPPWYQGDHMLFVAHGRPALAFTSEHSETLAREIIHTEGDALELVDCVKLAELAFLLRDLALEA